MKIGQTVTVDERSATFEERVCEFNCPHKVYTITRRNFVVIRKHQAPNHRDMGIWAGDPNWKPPLADVFTAVDAEGTRWEYMSGEGHFIWEADGGRTADNVLPGGRVRAHGTAYIFNDTTGGTDGS
ncbi:hypothetical protein [Arthrobacter mobilis]|uniref:Uncharacterized protein n=1 Tax=Arthrobacter mobilis TaxID=2724944 RepID=A0A7X6HGV5_9MICC|nr:hypothetical protein [Arthrobacter mobilis]NKX55994.1 hypothetical protein [Arthrobacter mobilis]